MTLHNLILSRKSDAPWYTRWYWWCAAGLIGLIALITIAMTQRMASKERAKKFKLVEDTTRVIAGNEHGIEGAKEVLKDATVVKRRLDELDDEIVDVDERYVDMMEKVDNATSLAELRTLREDIVRRGL